MGCADIAVRRILPAVSGRSDIVVTAVASRSPEKAEFTATLFGARPVIGYQPLLDRHDVDAVYIPLPPALHSEWILASLKNGKHVLSEKPMTTSPQETRKVMQKASRMKLALVENYMFLHHSQHRHVKSLVESGVIGDLRSFSAAFAIPRRPVNDLRHQSELGGGALLDVAGYPLKAACHFLAGPLQVLGATLAFNEGLGVDTGGSALLLDTNGVSANIRFGLDDMYSSYYFLSGTLGQIHLDRAFTPAATHTPTIRLTTRNGCEVLEYSCDDQYRNSISGFVEAVNRTEQSLEPLRQAELIDDIRVNASRVPDQDQKERI